MSSRKQPDYPRAYGMGALAIVMLIAYPIFGLLLALAAGSGDGAPQGMGSFNPLKAIGISMAYFVVSAWCFMRPVSALGTYRAGFVAHAAVLYALGGMILTLKAESASVILVLIHAVPAAIGFAGWRSIYLQRKDWRSDDFDHA